MHPLSDTEDITSKGVGKRRIVYSGYCSEESGTHALIGMNGSSRSLLVRVLSLTIMATDAFALVIPT